MNRYAILCGSAPEGSYQKKINGMHNFLTGEAGGSWAEKEIIIFPNGVSEAMLSFVLERLKADKTEQILLYICTLSPVAEGEESVWLGGEKVQKAVIESFCADGRGQVVYDSCREFVSDEETEDEMEVFSAGVANFSKSFGEIK